MCGENIFDGHMDYETVGSPPRVRGKHHVIDFAEKVVRITPACAGKTMVSCAPRIGSQDHPRVCGENVRGGKA